MIDKIKIGKLVYKIKYQEIVDNVLRFGQCDSAKQEILIATKFSVLRQKETLIHEVIHAVLNEYGIEHNESIPSIMAKVFTEIIIDNKKLIKEFLELKEE